MGIVITPRIVNTASNVLDYNVGTEKMKRKAGGNETDQPFGTLQGWRVIETLKSEKVDFHERRSKFIQLKVVDRAVDKPAL